MSIMCHFNQMSFRSNGTMTLDRNDTKGDCEIILHKVKNVKKGSVKVE